MRRSGLPWCTGSVLREFINGLLNNAGACLIASEHTELIEVSEYLTPFSFLLFIWFFIYIWQNSMPDY